VLERVEADFVHVDEETGEVTTVSVGGPA
jgi:hypothetical protein